MSPTIILLLRLLDLAVFSYAEYLRLRPRLYAIRDRLERGEELPPEEIAAMDAEIDDKLARLRAGHKGET